MHKRCLVGSWVMHRWVAKIQLSLVMPILSKDNGVVSEGVCSLRLNARSVLVCSLDGSPRYSCHMCCHPLLSPKASALCAGMLGMCPFTWRATRKQNLKHHHVQHFARLP
jgi:hypothetical protein